MESISKYMTGNFRVFFASLSDAVARSAELNGIAPEDTELLGKLEAYACCLAAIQKEERASVCVRLLSDGAGYSATAEKDGMIRGRKEEPGNESGQMEVSLRLPLRGTYTGVISGTDPEGMMRDYFAQSLQISAACRVFRRDDRYFCAVVEQLPGEATDPEEVCAKACGSLPDGIVPTDFTFLESTELRFGCTCSRAALLRLVSALSEDDRRDLSENGKIVTHCTACGKRYTFEV